MSKKKTFFIHPISVKLIQWYRMNKRDLPWRSTTNPYNIWISEIILQQTRVAQGLDYYRRFLLQFPGIKELANADENEILKAWQGLGYYSRARNLHKAANEIMQKHNGIFPEAYDDIRALKGIGDYTAAAIASFAFKLKHPVLDGNVFRFLSRHAGIGLPVNTTEAKKQFLMLANELMSDASPDEFNQAIMEFGALQCKVSSPDCMSCPLNDSCHAFIQKTVHEFPVKSPKQKIRKRFFYYLVIEDENHIYLQQRKSKDIWQHLFEFPLIESSKKLSMESLLRSDQWNTIFNKKVTHIKNVSEEKKHILSHQILYARYIKLSIQDKKFKTPNHWERIPRQELKDYAVPRLIDRYFEEEEMSYKD